MRSYVALAFYFKCKKKNFVGLLIDPNDRSIRFDPLNFLQERPGSVPHRIPFFNMLQCV